jgi:hypothetical protein
LLPTAVEQVHTVVHLQFDVLLKMGDGLFIVADVAFLELVYLVRSGVDALTDLGRESREQFAAARLHHTFQINTGLTFDKVFTLVYLAELVLLKNCKTIDEGL